ncbi:MAG: hypothetical protein CMQ41_12360 [Gammaproteobacteria bacterium]|nr:hypothetical protein [Gammaproteobacteria bacterium]
MKRFQVFNLLALFSFLIAYPSQAISHEVRPAYLQLVELTDGESNQKLEASLRQPQINGRYLGLGLETNCESAPISASLSEGALIEVFALDCSTSNLDTISIVGLERTLIDTLVSIQYTNGESRELLINGDKPGISLSNTTPGVPVYLLIGIEHLLLGFDHVLFVIMLLYIVRGLTAILIVVTSFTIAHSFTLVLSAFDVITLSSAPVEAVIAGSIVLLAHESISKRPSLTKQFPAFVAFLFGLLHGLGFAGALSEIGLPDNSQFMALFLFNVGIEIGQLIIIALVLAFLAVLRLRTQPLLANAPIYAAGGIASFWFIERSWAILV